MPIQEQKIFQLQTNAGVGQDKQPPGRLTAERGEPATAEAPAVGSKWGRATAIAAVVDRPTHHGSETRRTEQVTGRVLPVLKTQQFPETRKNQLSSGMPTCLFVNRHAKM